MTDDIVIPESPADGKPKLLLVDDDESFCSSLQCTFEQRGYEVRAARSIAQAREALQDWAPGFAVVDLRIRNATGLTLIPDVKAANPAVRLVVLTGYASIATAVEAIKLGATYYLTKPVEASAIEHAFGLVNGDALIALSEEHPSVSRLAWEYIQRMLAENGGNISATARALNMHRRTLQRRLNKFPAKR
jgi:two-component system response regulator RegA